MELLAMMRTPKEPGTLPGKVVLYYDHHNKPNPFITWWEDNQGGRCWGHYFEDEVRARKDFIERCVHMMRLNAHLDFEDNEYAARMVDEDGHVKDDNDDNERA